MQSARRANNRTSSLSLSPRFRQQSVQPGGSWKFAVTKQLLAGRPRRRMPSSVSGSRRRLLLPKRIRPTKRGGVASHAIFLYKYILLRRIKRQANQGRKPHEVTWPVAGDDVVIPYGLPTPGFLERALGLQIIHHSQKKKTLLTEKTVPRRLILISGIRVQSNITTINLPESINLDILMKCRFANKFFT